MDSIMLHGLRILSQSLDTGIGPIPVNMGDFISTVGGIGIGVGGVSAIGLVTAGAFAILTSAGDPEKLMNGREMITNALMGLALIVLALFVLELLGWDILGLGRLGGGYNIPFNSWSP